MKQLNSCRLFVLVSWLMLPQMNRAQGTVYLSNLGQPATGNLMVGSNSWLAMSFLTGGNLGGYQLGSIELGMTNASGNPSGFTASIYSSTQPSEYFPSSSLGALNGPGNPSTSGLYTFTPASSLTLSSDTAYFLVLTCGTAVANGAYESNLGSPNYSPNGGWQAPIGLGGPDVYSSADGSHWTLGGGTFQFAITATAIPEPAVLSLFALGGLGCLWRYRKGNAR
jgi:hypothetical protein